MPDLDVSGYLDDGALDLSGVASAKYPEGRTYRVASPSWPDTLRLRRLVSRFGGRIPDAAGLSGADLDDITALNTAADGTDCTIPEKLLGDALPQMIDDGVAPSNVDKIVTIVVLHFGLHEHVAQQFVEAAGEARARAERTRANAAKKPAPAKSSSSPRKAGSRSTPASGAANTPRRKASTRGSAASPPASNPTRRAG